MLDRTIPRPVAATLARLLTIARPSPVQTKTLGAWCWVCSVKPVSREEV